VKYWIAAATCLLNSTPVSIALTRTRRGGSTSADRFGLDDLITVKDKYGMALTHALHRGFSDLGPAMTDSCQIFLNADFILADGCLRNRLHCQHFPTARSNQSERRIRPTPNDKATS
jgi:hypothetical protein